MSTISVDHRRDGPHVIVDCEVVAFAAVTLPGMIFMATPRGALLTPEETIEFAKALLEVADYVAEEPLSK